MLIGLFAAGILAGCGQETVSDKPKEAVEKATESTEKEVKEAEVKFDLTGEASYPIYNDVMEETNVSYFAEITNTGEVPIDVTDANVTFTDKEGTVIGTSDSSNVWASPHVVEPGKKAYLSTDATIDGTVDTYGKGELTLAPVEAIDAVEELPIEGNTGKVDKYIYINGKVTNTTNQDTDYVTIAAGIYGKDGKFVGSTYGQIDTLLKPDASVGFESNAFEIPYENIPPEFDYEVLAYTYPSYGIDE
ncbi:FxLYD domain-containing protein [Priestia flexa]|uniref:FxLYD domain-containing protein n=1 Tax=Priestia flexa TaxID=86664 RepID=UPI003D07BCE8